MLKNLVKNSFWIAIAFFCAMHTSYAQGVDPTPQNPFPAGSALINIGLNGDGNLTMGGESQAAQERSLTRKAGLLELVHRLWLCVQSTNFPWE